MTAVFADINAYRIAFNDYAFALNVQWERIELNGDVEFEFGDRSTYCHERKVDACFSDHKTPMGFKFTQRREVF